MCRLGPSRAVLPDGVAAGYVESSGAIVLASPVKDDPCGAVVLGCCGTGVLAGASGFFSPHIYPPWARVCRNSGEARLIGTGVINLFPPFLGAKPKMEQLCSGSNVRSAKFRAW